MTRNHPLEPQPIRVHIIQTVLEAAKDAGDEHAIACCRRLLEANRRGWKQHRDSKEWALVQECYDSITE